MDAVNALRQHRDALEHLRTMLRATAGVDDPGTLHKAIKEMLSLVDNTLSVRR